MSVIYKHYSGVGVELQQSKVCSQSAMRSVVAQWLTQLRIMQELGMNPRLSQVFHLKVCDNTALELV